MTEDKPKRKYTRRAKVEGDDVEKEQDVEVADVELSGVTQSQLLTDRIFEGQSVDLPSNERIRRIKNALIEKGMSLDGVTLPLPDFAKYW